ncbi:hypothetical protein [Sphingomonas sp. PB4P5]|uniref:hypothetical protein n=1 Tax=Parasphingomonas puruogangriensis TaxID=3096155 RepID=UPI002FCB1BEB
MIVAPGLAVACFILGVVLMELCAPYFVGLIPYDMARQRDGYGATSLFTLRVAPRRDEDFAQGRL